MGIVPDCAMRSVIAFGLNTALSAASARTMHEEVQSRMEQAAATVVCLLLLLLLSTHQCSPSSGPHLPRFTPVHSCIPRSRPPLVGD